jgi:hypothetical protein
VARGIVLGIEGLLADDVNEISKKHQLPRQDGWIPLDFSVFSVFVPTAVLLFLRFFCFLSFREIESHPHSAFSLGSFFALRRKEYKLAPILSNLFNRSPQNSHNSGWLIPDLLIPDNRPEEVTAAR